MKKYKKDIFYYENFLDKQECSQIINFFESIDKPWLTSDKNISIITFFSVMDYSMDGEILNGIDVDWNQLNEILDKVHSVVEDSFNEKVTPTGLHLGRWGIGSSMDEHADDTNSDGSPTAFFFYKYASLIYLNENYRGGRIEFPEHNISIKPKTGSLIIFPGNKNNIHKVTKIKSGSRYTLSSWWYEDE